MKLSNRKHPLIAAVAISTRAIAADSVTQSVTPVAAIVITVDYLDLRSELTGKVE